MSPIELMALVIGAFFAGIIVGSILTKRWEEV